MIAGGTGGSAEYVAVPITVDRRTFRILLAGDLANIELLTKELPYLSEGAANEGGFLESLAPRLEYYHVVLADTLDLSTPAIPIDLFTLLSATTRLSSSEVAWVHIRYLLSEASESDLIRLVRSPNLVAVRSIVNSVLDDLDERADEERASLRSELPEVVGYALLN